MGGEFGLDGMRAVTASNNNSNDAGVNDDAATSAEMTTMATAAVAPRRRVGHRSKKKDMCVDGASSPPLSNGERKRRAVGVAFDTVAGPPDRLGRLKNDLTVNEIQVNPLLRTDAHAVQNKSLMTHLILSNILLSCCWKVDCTINFAVDSLVSATIDSTKSPHQYTRTAGHPNLVKQLARR